jgi:hypothetical protein
MPLAPSNRRVEPAPGQEHVWCAPRLQGEPWTLDGSLMEKKYAVISGGRPIVQIS